MKNKKTGWSFSKVDRLICLILSAVLLLSVGGCYLGSFLTPEMPPYNPEIAAGYFNTEIGESSSSDVLSMIYLPKYELLSQSKNVVACGGKKKDGKKMWFKMVGFDEDSMTARRKYLMIEDERPKVLFVEPWARMRFDCRVKVDEEVLAEPYSNDNARRIAILESVLESFRNDMDEIEQDNKDIAVCGMMVNQSLTSLMTKLDATSAAAADLDNEKGVEFEHINLDKGRLRMTVDDKGIATIKMRLGSHIDKWWKVSLEGDDYRE